MSTGSINTIADAQRLFSAARVKAVEAGGGELAAKRQEAAMASQQFEAIILRQLLQPVVDPMMGGGGGDGGGAGAGVYSYLVTDVLAGSLSEGGGLGLSHILQNQLTPKGGMDPAQAVQVYAQGKAKHHE
jgi:Rod binding domain-containing protein